MRIKQTKEKIILLPILMYEIQSTGATPHKPVSILSSTTALPLVSTASHGMTQPFGGITITSPGTRSLAGTSQTSKRTTSSKVHHLMILSQYEPNAHFVKTLKIIFKDYNKYLGMGNRT
jgi:hypothetical protein